jgi:hypothetical protein
MTHKQGDSFEHVIVLPDSIADGEMVGWNAASELRTSQGALVDTLTASWPDDPTRRMVRLLALDTTDWPVGELIFDVQFTREIDGFVRSTETMVVTVVRDVTANEELTP